MERVLGCLVLVCCSSEPTLGERVFEAYDAYASYDCGCAVHPEADPPYHSLESCLVTWHAYLELDVLSACFDEVERALPEDARALRCRYEVAAEYMRCRQVLDCMETEVELERCQAAADQALEERGCERRDLSQEAVEDGIYACEAEVSPGAWPYIGVRP